MLLSSYGFVVCPQFFPTKRKGSSLFSLPFSSFKTNKVSQGIILTYQYQKYKTLWPSMSTQKPLESRHVTQYKQPPEVWQIFCWIIYYFYGKPSWLHTHTYISTSHICTFLKWCVLYICTLLVFSFHWSFYKRNGVTVIAASVGFVVEKWVGMKANLYGYHVFKEYFTKFSNQRWQTLPFLLKIGCVQHLRKLETYLFFGVPQPNE